MATYSLTVSASMKVAPTSPAKANVNPSYAQARAPTQVFGVNTLKVTALDASPQTIPIGTVAKVRYLWLAVLSGGQIQLYLTTAKGSSQVVTVTGLVVIDNPTDGSEITAITASRATAGTSEIEYLVAGD